MGGARRELVTLGLSLVLHVCVLAVVLRSVPVPPPQPPRASTKPLELTRLVWLEHTPSAPTAAPTLPPRVEPKPASSGPARAAPPATTPRTAPSTPKPAAPSPGDGDSPRAITLTPSGTFALPGDGAGVSEPAHGVTLHPGDLPGADELLAEEHERVSARVGTLLHKGLAAARVRGGLPDPSYGVLGAELRKATDDVPRFIDTNSPKEVLGALMESWGAGAARYGRTGAPYDEPEGRLESLERPSALASAAASGNPDALAMASFLSAGARLQEFADGRAGLELYALVEIRQQPSGALDSVELIRPSGLRPFDAWVTDKAREVGVAFTFDSGARLHPLRSVWRFDGIIKYRRKLKLRELDGRAVVGMMTMAALSALSGIGHVQKPPPGEAGPERDLGPRMPAFVGRFDELTGEMDMVDLTNPTYDCKVTLLEAD